MIGAPELESERAPIEVDGFAKAVERAGSWRHLCEPARALRRAGGPARGGGWAGERPGRRNGGATRSRQDCVFRLRLALGVRLRRNRRDTKSCIDSNDRYRPITHICGFLVAMPIVYSIVFAIGVSLAARWKLTGLAHPEAATCPPQRPCCGTGSCQGHHSPS